AHVRPAGRAHDLRAERRPGRADPGATRSPACRGEEAMSTGETPPAPAPDMAVSSYSTLGLAALGVILLVLFEEGFGVYSLVPVLIGLIGVLTRWRAAPV